MIETFLELLTNFDPGLWTFLMLFALAGTCLGLTFLLALCKAAAMPLPRPMTNDEGPMTKAETTALCRDAATPALGRMDDERPQLKMVDTTGDERLRRWMKQQLVERTDRHFHI